MQSIYSKDSFDRFGDDLCELVLSFTSIEEKFKYECISRQWKRLLFNRQKELIIGFLFVRSAKDKELMSIEKTLRKFRNIRSIFMTYWFTRSKEEVFELIVKYCHNLTQIESDFDGLTQNTFKAFFDKFGSNLKEIKFHSIDESNEKALKFCPNLSVLNIKPFGKLSVIFNRNETFVKNVKKFSFEYNSDDLNRLKIFIESNKKSLESIELKVESNAKDLSLIMTELSKLTKLENLIIECNERIDKSFVKCLREFGNKCQNLKKIDLNLRTECNELNLEIFKSINCFKQLKSLKLEFNSFKIRKNYENELTSDALNNCKDITFLKINSFCRLSDNFFTNIDKHLPKLQNICCENTNASNQTLQSLSKLSNLRTIYFDSFTSKTLITESVVLELIRKCVKINLIEFTNIKTQISLNDDHISTLRGTDGENERKLIWLNIAEDIGETSNESLSSWTVSESD